MMLPGPSPSLPVPMLSRSLMLPPLTAPALLVPPISRPLSLLPSPIIVPHVLPLSRPLRPRPPPLNPRLQVPLLQAPQINLQQVLVTKGHPQPFLTLAPVIGQHPQSVLQQGLGVKTVFIISYSSEINKHDHSWRRIIPAGILTLLTVRCQKWRAPTAEICSIYSGVSVEVQRVVFDSRTAMAAMYTFPSCQIYHTRMLIEITEMQLS